ncbi:MAG: peptide deformylase [Bryobacterales bacterium]|nr:peptide deformylase [Bryobacterales bacterium]
MPARRILQLGDPLLRAVSAPVEPARARLLVRDLDATLTAFRRATGWGRGISAVQIGELSRVIFLRVDGVPYELINPRYTWQSPGKFELWDDCFSFPNLMVRVERHQRVRIVYQSLGGTEQELDASDALSELVQHEMDHLDGVLAVDRATGPDALATRQEWERRFRRS